jgi:hypothetical protein
VLAPAVADAAGDAPVFEVGVGVFVGGAFGGEQLVDLFFGGGEFVVAAASASDQDGGVGVGLVVEAGVVAVADDGELVVS